MNGYAMVIGMEAYEDVSLDGLSGCAQDAYEMAGLLRSDNGGMFQTVEEFVSEQDDVLTAERLYQLFDQLFTRSSRETDLLLYFSGHASRNAFGFHLLGGDNASTYAATVPFDSLMRRAAQAQFRSFTVVLDCCFAGAALDLDCSSLPDNESVLGSLHISAIPENVTVLASSLRDGKSFMGHRLSKYTQLLVDGLSGPAADREGYITAADLHRWVSSNAAGADPESDGPKPVLKAHVSLLPRLRKCQIAPNV